MTVKEYAEMLNGREYGYPQFTKEEIQIAKENGFVIVYGASDDLMEFEGALYDEAGCFDGGTVYVCETGVIEYGSTETKHIEAVWCDTERKDTFGNTITWTYKTDIPHETFMIYDNDKPYCEAIVFSIDDIR